jgi:hypothetical protein
LAGSGVNAGVPWDPVGMAMPLKRNWASGLLRRPLPTRLSLIGSDEAAVAVDDVDLARRLDRSENLARGVRGIVDLVEGDPFVRVGPGLALVETQRGVAPNVEGLPVQQRGLPGLADVDGGGAAPRRFDGKGGPRPDRGSGTDSGIDLKPTRAQAVGDVWQGRAGCVGIDSRVVARGRGAGGGL